MDTITKIAYAIIASITAWLILCGIIVITTGDTAGIQVVADATVGIVDRIVGAIEQLLPVIK
jgi:hypothetical protein